MANANVSNGFRTWGVTMRAQMYAVQTAPTINISVGDLVAQDTVGGLITAKFGVLSMVYDAAVLSSTPGDEFLLLGTVLACFDKNMDPLSYIPAATVGDGTVAGYVLVADHPEQLFVANVDAALVMTDLELNYAFSGEALYAPNSSTYISKQYITVTGANTTNTIPLQLLYQAYPGIDVSTAAGCRMVCRIQPACHRFGASTAL
jgi:hypothetical protein